MENEKKEPITQDLANDVTKRIFIIMAICIGCMALLYGIMIVAVVKCKTLKMARVVMMTSHALMLVFFSIPLLVSSSIFLSESKPSITIMMAKLYAIIVIPTFLLLEFPTTGNFMISLFENTLGISLIEFFPVFKTMSAKFTSLYVPTLPAFSFPLGLIMPLLNIKIGDGTFIKDEKNGAIIFDDGKIKKICEDYSIEFNDKEPETVKDMFELCVCKNSIGHAMWVFVSLISASYTAAYVSF